MKKVLLVVLVCILAAVGYFAYVMISTSKELTPVAEGILRRIGEGKADEVYAEASDRFRAEISREDFRAWVADRNAALGAFRAVRKTTGVGSSASSSRGREGKVNLDLAFEKADTKGEVHFVKVDGTWRLLGIQVEIPKAAEVPADPSLLRPMAEELLGLLSKGELVALYQRFSPELKAAWPAEAFERNMRTFRGKVGAIGESTFERLEKGEQGELAAVFTVAFERGSGTARVKGIWRRGAWDVLGFSVKTK